MRTIDPVKHEEGPARSFAAKQLTISLVPVPIGPVTSATRESKVPQDLATFISLCPAFDFILPHITCLGQWWSWKFRERMEQGKVHDSAYKNTDGLTRKRT